MAKGYLSEQEIYEIEVAIYNDDHKALHKIVSKGDSDDDYEANIKELVKDQEYILIPETTVLLRKDGRLINYKYLRSIKSVWTPNEFMFNPMPRRMYKFSEVYKENGWKFDHREITLNYKNNNWDVTTSRIYRPIFENYK